MTTTTLPERHDYMSNGCARTYRSTAGTQPAVPAAQLDELMGQLQRDGFVVLERLFDDQQVSRMREDLLERFSHTGRNSFEGALTQRLYAVIAKTRVCDALVEHPLILGLLDRLLAPNYLLSQLQAINILPGSAPSTCITTTPFTPWRARGRPMARRRSWPWTTSPTTTAPPW